MMEVGSPSLQNVGRARHTEKMFIPEERSPSELPLGVPAGDNRGASMLPQNAGRFPSVSNMPLPLPSPTTGGYPSMLSGSLVENEAVPMPSFDPVSGIETVTVSPPATIDGNQTPDTSPPDSELSPPIPTAANCTTPIMPQNSLVELNVGSAKEFNKHVLRDGGNGNIVIPPVAAPVDTERTRVDIDNFELNMATQPVGESQSSQADFNNIYSSGETQLVHDNQVGLDNTQPPFSGETQLDNGHEDFDDMVILQNDTLTASAIPLTNAGQSVSLEPIQGTDAQPLQDSFDVPGSTHMGNISNNGIPASYESNALTGERNTYGPNERVSVTEAPTLNEHPEVHPAETAGQLGLTEGKEEKDTNTSEPQLGLLNENVKRKGKADEGMMPKDVEAEIGVKDDVFGKAKVVSEQEIQAIKGRKVVKKFGRKNYGGEVVDYDAENQWFKVAYEDGDEEDLELLEVKGILLTGDTPSNASTAKRKRSHPEAAVLARKRKRTPKKKGVKKKSQQVKSPPGSKTKRLKRSAKSKSSLASDHESPVQSQPTSGAKRKRSSDIEAMTSSKLESEDTGGTVKSRGNKQSGNAKTPRKSSAKRGAKARPKKYSARKTGTRRRSISKLPTEESEKALEAGEGEKGGKSKGKHRKIDTSEDFVEKAVKKDRKIDTSEDQDALVGKAVKKDFDGTSYSGVVAKFDKKWMYYKVEYEDGDQEEMELEELKAVLVL